MNAATIPAVETTNGPSFDWRNVIGANQSATVGWSFQVGAQDLELDALGMYDPGANGLLDPHAVGIWNSSGTLLAQVTVPAGTAGTQVGSYIYEATAPLTLAAGQTYVIGAYFAPVVDRCGSACGDSLLLQASETYAPGITFLQSRQSQPKIGDGPLSLPALNAGVNEGFFGPNFLITAPDQVLTPEPSSFGLIGLGVIALSAISFFKKS